MSSMLLTNWKEEPLSPINSNDEGTGLFDDDHYQTPSLDIDGIKLEYDDIISFETKAEAASQMLDNLENLIDLDELIKEESYLLNEEEILPMLEEVESPCAIEPLQLVKMETIRNQDTNSLLKEFESLYNVVEYTHGTLTPPQSPPSEQRPILTTLEPILTTTQQQQQQQQSTYPTLPNNKLVPEKQLLASSPHSSYPLIEYPALATPQPDIAHELAVVDELVRTRVEDMQWISNGPSSPNSNTSSSSSSSSSSCSNFGDCSSSEDPEWVPEPIDNYNCPENLKISARKRNKNYTRVSPYDKKSRKKEQNKNAATRYRMKKKAEVEVILSEEKILLQKNDELHNKINDVQREIKYLKGLMRDLFKAKGLIN